MTLMYMVHTYMLFAGWEVRIVNNCDRGLFQAWGHSFSLYGPTLCRQILIYFFPAINWLTIGFPQLCQLSNWFTCRLQTIVKNLTNERASKLRHYTKKDVLKNIFILNCFMLVASNSPFKFSKSVFLVKFRAKFDWSCTTNKIFYQSLRITRNQTFLP